MADEPNVEPPASGGSHGVGDSELHGRRFGWLLDGPHLLVYLGVALTLVSFSLLPYFVYVPGLTNYDDCMGLGGPWTAYAATTSTGWQLGHSIFMNTYHLDVTWLAWLVPGAALIAMITSITQGATFMRRLAAFGAALSGVAGIAALTRLAIDLNR